jgi:uncharacterized protein YacL
MSEELTNITDAVMKKIHTGNVKMHSRAYFVIGSLLVFAGLVCSIVASVFLISLVRFSLRTHGPMGEYRLEQMLSSFPWWAVVFAFFGLVVGLLLLRRYDFSHKIHFGVLVAVFVLAVIAGGWVLDATGLNSILFKKGPGQGMMRQYLDNNEVHNPHKGAGKNVKNRNN